MFGHVLDGGSLKVVFVHTELHKKPLDLLASLLLCHKPCTQYGFLELDDVLEGERGFLHYILQSDHYPTPLVLVPLVFVKELFFYTTAYNGNVGMSK